MKLSGLFSFMRVLVVVVLLYAGNAIAQKRVSHLEIDGGLAYSQLHWHSGNVVLLSGGSLAYAGSLPYVANMTDLLLLPAFRVGLDIPIKSFRSASFEPFIGYHGAGGESPGIDEKTYGYYQYRWIFRALTLGWFANDRLLGYRLSLGLRYDAYLKRNGYYLMDYPGESNKKYWNKRSITYKVNNHSISAGLRISHPVWKSISLEAAGWYGLSNIASVYTLDGYFVRPIQFQLMLSYRL